MDSLVSLRLEAGQKENHQFDFVIIEDGIKAKVDVTVRLEYAEYGIDINVTFNSELELICSRCLETFTKMLSMEHSIIIASSEKGWDLDEDTLEMRVIDLSQSSFDVKELVRQLLVESQEMRPVCSEDCQGLCPVCGMNIRDTECNCNNEFVDPRWSRLKNIVIDKEKEEV